MGNPISAIERPLRYAALVLGLALAGCSDPESVKQANFDYAGEAMGWPSCDSPRQALEGSPPEFRTAGGIRVVVKTPANYRANVAHPLIVLFAPGGQSSERSERHHGITKEATAKGFVVAVAEDQAPDFEVIKDMATIPDQVAKSWCVDQERIFATGHSNGGLYSNAMAFFPDVRGAFRAIAPSAAGIRKQDLEAYSCPKPTPVLIYHGARDIGFAGYGRSAAEWWAKCNGCDGEEAIEGHDGCIRFQSCKPGGETVYCEGPWFHTTWPARNTELLEFFRQNGKFFANAGVSTPTE